MAKHNITCRKKKMGNYFIRKKKIMAIVLITIKKTMVDYYFTIKKKIMVKIICFTSSTKITISYCKISYKIS